MNRRLSLMAVHAHPDDESSSTGGVLARSAAEGVETVVVTCTNGEYGDAPDHVKPGEAGHDPEQVAKIRRAELDRACEHLAVAHLEVLGYHDSGMPDWSYKDRSDVFASVPLAEPVDRLVGLLDHYRPDVVITYDDMGGYGHPDHLRAHEVTVAAVEASDIPTKLYLIARRRGDWDRIREAIQASGVDVPAPPQRMLSPEQLARIEARETLITTTVDVTAVIERKRAALLAHVSQLDGSWWLAIPSALFADLFGHETFIRARDRSGAPIPEDDLFAGLR